MSVPRRRCGVARRDKRLSRPVRPVRGPFLFPPPRPGPNELNCHAGISRSRRTSVQKRSHRRLPPPEGVVHFFHRAAPAQPANCFARNRLETKKHAGSVSLAAPAAAARFGFARFRNINCAGACQASAPARARCAVRANELSLERRFKLFKTM